MAWVCPCDIAPPARALLAGSVNATRQVAWLARWWYDVLSVRAPQRGCGGSAVAGRKCAVRPSSQARDTPLLGKQTHLQTMRRATHTSTSHTYHSCFRNPRACSSTPPYRPTPPCKTQRAAPLWPSACFEDRHWGSVLRVCPIGPGSEQRPGSRPGRSNPPCFLLQLQLPLGGEAAGAGRNGCHGLRAAVRTAALHGA